jgi:hypothetical protein
MKGKAFSLWFRYLGIIFCSSIMTGCGNSGTQDNWWRGNMHAHTFWSDGQNFPENVAKWYKDNGYNFLVYTDHNRVQEGERWATVTETHQAVKDYAKIAGEDWVVHLAENHQVKILLRRMDEFREKFEEPEKFLLIMGEEISERNLVHILAYNIDQSFPPIGVDPDDKGKMIQENLDRIRAYSERTGRKTLAALAHPNYLWAVTAEMMAGAADLKFFEVFNSSVIYWNNGDALRVNTDRLWDIVLALRLGKMNGQPIYGLATDDTHHYHGYHSGPGRGWVMVRSRSLNVDSILEAMDQGDFYSTTGINLIDVNRKNNKIKVKIKPEKGVKYITEYMWYTCRF